jgi:hypothetical protein
VDGTRFTVYGGGGGSFFLFLFGHLEACWQPEGFIIDLSNQSGFSTHDFSPMVLS